MSSTKGDAPLHDAGRLERGDDTTNSSQKSEANAANSHQAAPPITKSAVIRALQPMQNGFVESFNGSSRDECLNETLFSSLPHARAEITAWKEDYNRQRPHSSLGNITPNEFAMKMAMEKQAA